MPTNTISYRDTNYFSSVICDYLDEKESLKVLYNRFPNLNNFEQQIEEKGQSFDLRTRSVLVSALKSQYSKIDVSAATTQNIEILNESNTFTVTTGHQLNLFTGPLYFLYKIISTINLTEELKATYPNNNFVPIYWMASEDHDFAEINYFNFKGKKVQLSREVSGAVGRLTNQGLDQVLEVFSKELGYGENADVLKALFENAYLDNSNLTDGTRFLANALFKKYGLVIIDGDAKELKQLFKPYVKRELLEKVSYKEVIKTNKQIDELNYKIQVNPREINLFYLDEGIRERIIEQNGEYIVNNINKSFTENEMLAELESHPERFSPNALLRPLYQEVILPNLCYIGGGGELTYWFQLKSYFEAVDVTFPIILLRNSVLLKTEKQQTKIEKLGLTLDDMFLKQDELVNIHTKELSKIDIDFSAQKKDLKEQFEKMYKLAELTDKSFLGAVGAQERKQLKGLEHLEKRLLKAQKRKLKEELDRLKELQDQLFPGQSLQERNTNFSEFYLEYGEALIDILKKELKPLKGDFTIVEI